MFTLGCSKDKFDARDYVIDSFLPKLQARYRGRKKLPRRLDCIRKMTPVRDQGVEGTCVGFASATGMKEYQEKIDYNQQVTLSPRFVYSECKKIDGFPGEEGTTIRAAMKVLKRKGTCHEDFWPYRVPQTDRPKAGAAQNAKKFRIKTYARVRNLTQLKKTLKYNGPCVVGVYVFSSWSRMGDNGVIPLPNRYDQYRGGHAICVVGYDNKKKLIKFKNSWGADWGVNGYGYISYQYIQWYMIDAWSSVDISDSKPLRLRDVSPVALRLFVLRRAAQRRKRARIRQRNRRR